MVLLGVERWLDKVLTSLGFHLERTLVPIGLSPLYELPRVSDLRAPRYWVLALVLASVSLLVLALRRRWPAGLIAWIWYVAFLAPVTAMAHVGPQITADRYSYLPALGPLLLVGTAAGALVEAARAGRRSRGGSGSRASSSSPAWPGSPGASRASGRIRAASGRTR
jgi:predicted cobalt transporter CbtA